MFFKRAIKEGIDITTIKPNLQEEHYREIVLESQSLGISRLCLEIYFRYDCGAIHSNIFVT